VNVGSTELGILLLLLLVVVGVPAFVGWDLSRRGLSGVFWAVVTFLALPIGIVAWIVLSARHPVRAPGT